ncbi:hypothetical protein HS7_12710 [Sulfolobales archaeon HS-7]|nr:hypothetical protein HS7_12710 [Sulfolobales archaeon HS-7]
MKAQSSVIVMIAVMAIFFLALSSIVYVQMIMGTITNEYKSIYQIDVLKGRESLLVTVYQSEQGYVLTIVNNGPIQTRITGIFAVCNSGNYLMKCPLNNGADQTLSPQQSIVLTYNPPNPTNVEAYIVVTMYGNVYYAAT